MLVDALIFFTSLCVLLVGSFLSVKSGQSAASRLGMSTVVIGVTVLSIGTSLPEISTSITSFVGDSGGVGLGNILGSELVQITLILGVVGFLSVLQGVRRDIFFYGLWMTFGVLVASLFVFDGVLSFGEGVVLCLLYVFFVVVVVRRDKELVTSVEKDMLPWWKIWVYGLLGIGGVIGGSVFLLESTLRLSSMLGVPSYLVSFFIVGLGTSLPELFVSGVAAWKEDSGMSVGNLLGSNVTDPLFSLGIGSVVAGTSSIANVSITSLAYTVFVFMVVLGLFYWRRKVGKRESVVLFVLYSVTFYVLL